MTEKKSIYVATHKFTDLTKVGVSKNVNTRLKSFKTQVGYHLTLLYESPKISNFGYWESKIKDKFKESQFEGEWFNITGERIVEYIKTIENSFELPEYESLYEGFDSLIPRYEEIKELPKTIIFVEDYIIRGEDYEFYIKYYQTDMEKIVKFVKYSDAVKFKNRNRVRLIKII